MTGSDRGIGEKQSLKTKQNKYAIHSGFEPTTIRLRQGWVWFERTCVFNGIQFTKHFIEFIFVETNEVVRSNSNVILTRQTCGHGSASILFSHLNLVYVLGINM